MPEWKHGIRANLDLTGFTAMRQEEIVEDLAQQLDDAYQDALARGLPEADAAALAWSQCPDWQQLSRDLGLLHRGADVRLSKGHAARGARPLSLSLRDVRYAWRLIRRQPAFNSVAILTLALGIGTTTAVFTIVNGVLLRPLPYRDPSRLVTLFYGHHGTVSPWLSPLNVRDYIGPSGAFAEASAVAPVTVNVTGLGDPERLQGARVSWNYFKLLGVSMALGRSFVEGDAQGDGSQIVISDGLWRRRFGGWPDAVNSTTTLDGHDVTIVGVAPAALKFPAAAEFWQPLIFKPRDLAPAARGEQWVQVLARLKDGVSLSQATAALQTVADRLATDFPETEKDATLLAIPLHERIVSDIRPTLVTLFGAVTLVLLIACANVANLLFAAGRLAVARWPCGLPSARIGAS